MTSPRLSEIKREKKKSLFFREVSSLVQQLSAEDAAVAKVYVTRVDFSQDYGLCYIYFSTYGAFSQEVFDAALDRLKLYKPSMRQILAKKIVGRYTPDLKFFYDTVKEKEYKINQLLDKVSEELSAKKDN
jgi:ribosome-binding factor A